MQKQLFPISKNNHNDHNEYFLCDHGVSFVFMVVKLVAGDQISDL